MNQADPALGHGGRIDAMAAAFPAAPRPWLDLSTGISPFAYPVPALAPEAWQRLPTAADRAACEAAMAAAFGCPASACRAVAGTEAAIRQLPALLPVRRVALSEPSYADHARVWGAAGAELIVADDPLVHAETADAVVIVNPNNPDGRRWSPASLENARALLAARGGWLILDEAYADLDPQLSMAPAIESGGLIVLRSFGKFFGLAGVRMGAVLTPPSLRDTLDDLLGSWDVSGPALAIGAAAYADRDWQAKARRDLDETMHGLRDVLSRAHIKDLGGTDLFRYVRVHDAVAVWRHLAQHGIAIRRFAGDTRHVRIGLPANAAGLARLAAALRSMMT